jgi:GxxExxY protein
MQHADLTERIIGCAMQAHSTLGPGFAESIYHAALVYELTKSGIKVESKVPVRVFYDGVVIGNFEPDLLVESSVIVEIKAVQSLAAVHEVQVVNYLTATQLDVGLLINFGAPKLQFKRKHRLYKPAEQE